MLKSQTHEDVKHKVSSHCECLNLAFHCLCVGLDKLQLTGFLPTTS